MSAPTTHTYWENAIKGDFGPFNPPSPIFYILDLDNTGGQVTVEIPADAAIPFPPYTTSAAATFNNFHQDVWTVQLRDLHGLREPAGDSRRGTDRHQS